MYTSGSPISEISCRDPPTCTHLIDLRAYPWCTRTRWNLISILVAKSPGSLPIANLSDWLKRKCVGVPLLKVMWWNRNFSGLNFCLRAKLLACGIFSPATLTRYGTKKHICPPCNCKRASHCSLSLSCWRCNVGAWTQHAAGRATRSNPVPHLRQIRNWIRFTVYAANLDALNRWDSSLRCQCLIFIKACMQNHKYCAICNTELCTCVPAITPAASTTWGEFAWSEMSFTPRICYDTSFITKIDVIYANTTLQNGSQFKLSCNLFFHIYHCGCMGYQHSLEAHFRLVMHYYAYKKSCIWSMIKYMSLK